MLFAPSRLLVIGLTVFQIIGQQPAPVFRTGTRLVEVTVTVLDKKGNAVSGLGQTDFTILDEGKARPVALFHFDGVPEATPASGSPVALPPGVFSNHLDAGGSAPRNITALVLDTINTPPQQSVVVRAQMMRYLTALAPQTRVAVFHMGQQLRILHDFTDDAAALRAKLDKTVLGMPLAGLTDYRRSVVEAEAFVDMFAGDPAAQAAALGMARNMLEVEGMSNAAIRRYRMERTLAAMETLGRHLAGIPGRKNLVWIGGGFSMMAITGNLGMGPHGTTENFESKVRETSQRLAQEGIILYIVDSKGIELPSDTGASSRALVPPRGRGRFEAQMDSDAFSDDPRPAMGLMAAVTGGRYLHNTNDLTMGFKQTLKDMQASYTLGFYTPDDPDDKWHKLKIRVKGNGLNARYREGYLADSAPAQPVAWTAELWRTAFTNPVGSTAIPLTAKCEITASGELALMLIADANALSFGTDGNNLKAELEIAIADVAADGSASTNRAVVTALVPAAKWEETRKQGVTYQRQWKPSADTSSLRVIVHDARSGHYGSLDVPFNRLAR